MDASRSERATQVHVKIVHQLRDARYWSIPRIAIDVTLWVSAIALATGSNSPWVVMGAIICIGAIAMHDLLAQGHEGIHGMIARRPWVNELLTWFTHAVVGFSGTAYRAFHLDHHRYAQTERDPEYRLLNRVVLGAPGWAYLLVPAVFHLAINTYPMRIRGRQDVIPNTIRDLVGMVGLHVALMMGLGMPSYLLFVILPIGTSFACAMVIRSICEHHGAPGGNRWTNTRTTITTPLLSFVWSNVNYHLEHHLFPFIPFHKLPLVRRLLAEEFIRRGSIIDRGYVRTSIRLLGVPHHIASTVACSPPLPSVTTKRYMVRGKGLAFQAKVLWFKDILGSPQARRYLWSLYYAGEAYQALHPQGVFIKKLEPPFDKLLARHLRDEDRHAGIFRGLLRQEGTNGPTQLAPEQDVGWYLLTHVLPDIVQEAETTTTFSVEDTQRYMAFLHALELRSISDLCALLVAARQQGEMSLVDKIRSILRDERFHATYTHGIVFRLAKDTRQARSVIDQVRTAERKYYTESLNAILTHFERLGTVPATFLGRLRWRVLKAVTRMGGAVPLLPIYDRVPSRVMAGLAL